MHHHRPSREYLTRRDASSPPPDNYTIHREREPFFQRFPPAFRLTFVNALFIAISNSHAATLAYLEYISRDWREGRGICHSTTIDVVFVFRANSRETRRDALFPFFFFFFVFLRISRIWIENYWQQRRKYSASGSDFSERRERSFRAEEGEGGEEDERAKDSGGFGCPHCPGDARELLACKVIVFDAVILQCRACTHASQPRATDTSRRSVVMKPCLSFFSPSLATFPFPRVDTYPREQHHSFLQIRETTTSLEETK